MVRAGFGTSRYVAAVFMSDNKQDPMYDTYQARKHNADIQM